MKRTAYVKPVSDTYLAMVRQFPLRPIRSDAECRKATAILDQWFGRDDMDDGRADYVRVLAGLVADYEEARHPLDESLATPLDRLKHLMEENDMSTADLGRLLGNSGLASQIMHGRRELSKANIRKLAERFSVDAGYLL
jgi:HTH-type transcriptional regulator/antitoxin HigA